MKTYKNAPSRYETGRCTVVQCCGLAEADSTRGASVSAGAALGALIGVDAVDIALGDSANGTFVDAGAASNAVFTNYVSHSLECFKMNNSVYCAAKVLTFDDSRK